LSVANFLWNSQNYNILFIAVDDLKPELNCYGETQIISPNIDKLASEGVVFQNAYCQWSVCGPSRASILSGQTPDGTGIRNLKSLLRTENPDVTTLPEFFKNLGYTTAAAGKVFDPRNVDNGHDSPSWTISYDDPGSYTYPSEYGSFVSGKQYRVTANTATEMGPEGVGFDGYQDGQICLDGLSKLDQFSQNPDQPFFLAVGFKKPHIPFVAPKEYWDLYNRSELNLEPFQKIAEGAPEYAYHKPEPLGYTDIPDLWTYSDIEMGDGLLHPNDQRKLIHGYYACVSYIDDLVGKLLNKLEETGLDKNTIVVFWGDHGYHLGDHNQWGKHTNFEEATRVPLIIHMPYGATGVANEEVDLTDIYPTLVSLTGNDIPDNLQGYELTPLFFGNSIYKTCAVSEYRASGHSSYSFRTKQYRLTIWNNSSEVRPDVSEWNETAFSAVELYDYIVDPLEKKNLATDGAYETVKDSLLGIARNWWIQQRFFLTEGFNPMYKSAFNYILNNPGFEEGIHSGWTYNTNNDFSAEYSGSTYTYEGTETLSINVITGGLNHDDGYVESEYYNCFSALHGQEIKVSAIAKNISGSASVRYKITVVNFNGSQEEHYSESLSVSEEFDSLIFSFAMPVSAEKWNIALEYGTASGELLIDNVSILSGIKTYPVSTQNAEYPKNRFFPNPAKEKINLGIVPEPSTHLSVIDLSGKIWYSGNITSGIFDVNELEQGYYIFQLLHQQYLYTEKVLILN
jgi:arylsulfatase A-like enzyme